MEQDPNEWWCALVQVVRKMLADFDGRVEVDAIGLSSQSDTLVCAGSDGAALRPAILWMDGRAAAEAAELGRGLGESEIHRITGLRADPTFTAAKILWVRRHEPEVFEKTRWFMQPKDYVLWRLTGEAVTDPSTASRSMMYDQTEGAWSPKLLTEVGITTSRLPTIELSSAAAGHLTPAAAAALGLQDKILVACGGTDRACEALGAGIAGDRAMVSSGTATNVAVVCSLAARPQNPVLVTPNHVIPGQVLVQAALPTSGAVWDWFANLAGSTADEMSREAGRAERGSGGLLVLPFLMGARSVRWRPDACGVVHGLSLSTTRADFARAIVEGVALEVRACLAAIEQDARRSSELMLLGGLHQSVLWCQVLADVTERLCLRPSDANTSLVGAMLLAASCADGNSAEILSGSRARLEISATYEPDPEAAETYRVLGERYEDLIGQLWPAVSS